MFEASGKLRYSLKKPESDQNYWLVLDRIDEEVGRVYRNLYWLDHNKGHKLARPYWGLHVTVVRNEKPPNMESWRKHEDEEITFKYRAPVRNNVGPERWRSFWWVDVTCPRLDEIREELGLPPNSDRTYHMTIGSLDDDANRHIYEELVRSGRISATKTRS